MKNHKHYYKSVKHLNHIDVYRVLDLYEVNNPCLQHAIKKLLVAGGRGSKDKLDDIQEAIDSLERFKDMRKENSYEPNEKALGCRSFNVSNPDLIKEYMRNR